MTHRDIRPEIEVLIGRATLPEIERQLYWCACWIYLKPESVAQVLGVTRQTVNNKIRRYSIPVAEWREIRRRQSKIF